MESQPQNPEFRNNPKNCDTRQILFCVDASRPCQQFFSNIGIISCLPGLNQYKAASKVSFSWAQHSDSIES